MASSSSVRSPSDRGLVKTPGHAPAFRQRPERTTPVTETNWTAPVARRPTMSADPRHFSNVLHRPDTGDADRRRGRGDDQVVGSAPLRVAARLLGPGVILVVTPLAPMGGRAADHHHAGADRHVIPTTHPPNQTIHAQSSDVDHRVARTITKGPDAPSLPGRWAGGPERSIEFIDPAYPARSPRRSPAATGPGRRSLTSRNPEGHP